MHTEQFENELRTQGDEILSAMYRDGFRDESRQKTRDEIMSRLPRTKDAKYVGGWIMAQLGYGGGL